jgi:hypothetical protein
VTTMGSFVAAVLTLVTTVPAVFAFVSTVLTFVSTVAAVSFVAAFMALMSAVTAHPVARAVPPPPAAAVAVPLRRQRSRDAGEGDRRGDQYRGGSPGRYRRDEPRTDYGRAECTGRKHLPDHKHP